MVAAQKAKIPVHVVDSQQASLDKGLKFRDKLLEKDVAKQRLSKDEAETVKGRFTSSTNMEDLSDVDFVIEAVPVSRGTSESRRKQ